jgi:hypothetical protein
MKLIKILKNNLIEIKCLTLKNLCMMGSLHHHHNKSISFYSQQYVDKTLNTTNQLESQNGAKLCKLAGGKPSVKFNMSPMSPSKPTKNVNKQIKSILKRKSERHPRNTNNTTEYLKTGTIRFAKREYTTKSRRKSASIVIVSV